MHDVNTGSHGNENNRRRVQRSVSGTSSIHADDSRWALLIQSCLQCGGKPGSRVRAPDVGGRAGLCGRIKMIDGGTFGLACGIVAGPVHRLQEPRRHHGRRGCRGASDHQNNANSIRSRCDRVSIRTTRRFPFDLWPLFGDTDIGLGSFFRQLDDASSTPDRFTLSQQLQQPSPAHRRCHSYFIAYQSFDNARCLRLDFRSSSVSYCPVRMSVCLCDHPRWEGAWEEVSMTSIGFVSLKRVVITH